MTNGQRKAHVIMWLVLGPMAIFGLVLAVLWRPIEPVQKGPLPGVDVSAVEPEEASP